MLAGARHHIQKHVFQVRFANFDIFGMQAGLPNGGKVMLDFCCVVRRELDDATGHSGFASQFFRQCSVQFEAQHIARCRAEQITGALKRHHLSLLEHGIYGRLLDVYYTREAAIPDAQAARLIGARSKDEREALTAVLGEFFDLVDGMWHQSRCDAEIEAYLGKSLERAKRQRPT